MFKVLTIILTIFGTLYGAESNPISPTSANDFFPTYHNHPYIIVDFLYWVAKQEGNNYAATGTAITVPGTTDPNTGETPPFISSKGNIYAPTPVAKPGFKTAIGINLDYDHWDLGAEYTYLRSKETSSITSNNLNSGILPLFSYTPNNSILSNTTAVAATGATGFVSLAKGQWSLQFNNINLELGKIISFSNQLAIHPHFGLEGSWQSQYLNVDYWVSSTVNTSQLLGSNQVLFDQQFWGVGPRLGLDALWQCFNHLGLFANSGFAALWGEFKTVSKSYDTNMISNYANILIMDQLYKPMTLSPIIQLEIGGNYSYLFRNQYRFGLNVAWETQVWFFQNQHTTSLSDTNLILQGLTLGARFDY